jgi:DNA repair protein RecN (Recombination protein N)
MMLRTLRIRQFVIFEDSTVEFGSGLNLFTGETGAGKSILVDALGLASGARADRSQVRAGSAKATVEAQYEVEEGSPTHEWAQNMGLSDLIEEGQLIVRREVPVEGSGRILLNGSPCTLGQLRQWGERLVELHGQHEHQSLLSPERHLALLDHASGNAALLALVSDAYEEVLRLRDRRDRLRAAAEQREERKRQLSSIIRDIDAVDPRPGEMNKLERERRILRNASEVAQLLHELVGLCYEGDPAAATLASSASRLASRLAELDPSLEGEAKRLEAAALELHDVGSAFRNYREGIDFNPSRLEALEARIVALERLLLRFGEDEEAILAHRGALSEELQSLHGVEAELESIEGQVRRAEKAYSDAAKRLGIARKAASGKLASAVEAQFHALALKKARFEIQLSKARGEELSIPGDGRMSLGARGAEMAEFLLAANPGEPSRPLGKTASGGELSRVMLALHAVVDGAGEGRVLVFDEVDAGIGGAVADAVGARLARLARNHQVLCVTHLPQVAAYADRHFAVSKSIAGGRTQAHISALADAERVTELARMLGGREATATSVRHASELLAAAERAPRGGRSGSRRKA